jgi:hypothetical protein
MPLSAPTAPVLSKSSGNVNSNVNNLRSLKTFQTSETANGLDNLQSQVNNVVNALMNPGEVTQIQVYDQKGTLIGWIGSTVINNVSYEGAWFGDLYIGGASPANAVIVANGGGVTITGAAIQLTSNGLETDINNETLPVWGAGVSIVSIDTSVSNGDQSFMAPQAFGVATWNGASYSMIAAMGDAGSGQGFLQLNGIGNSDQITLGIDPATITIFDGTHTTALGPTEILTPLLDANAYQAAGVPGVDLTSTMLTAASITAGSFDYGSSVTVNTSGTGVFGTPGTGQTNGTVVTGVTLNTTHSNIVTAASVTSTNRQWSKGILTT